jgi:hypothetical protein
MVVRRAGCPLHCGMRLQEEVALRRWRSDDLIDQQTCLDVAIMLTYIVRRKETRVVALADDDESQLERSVLAVVLAGEACKGRPYCRNFAVLTMGELRLTDAVAVEEDEGWETNWSLVGAGVVLFEPGFQSFFDHAIHLGDFLACTYQ